MRPEPEGEGEADGEDEGGTEAEGGTCLPRELGYGATGYTPNLPAC